MLSELLNFKGINWWTLLGGLGLNFFITVLLALVGAYLNTNAATEAMYQGIGPIAMILLLFLLCGISGFILVKIADQVPFKHAILSSLGAFIPLVGMGIIMLDPITLMMAALAVAGNANGAMVALRQQHKNRHFVMDEDDEI